MKILTLNTHSLIEAQYEEKLNSFVEMVLKEKPDMIGLQEVNQTIEQTICPSVLLNSYVKCEGYDGVIHIDNHAVRISEMLRKRGLCYYWTWIPLKVGYGIYDEGLAVFSRRPIAKTKTFTISQTDDYQNWKRRRLLGIQVEGSDDWFCTVHMGWWDDEEEPFRVQWDNIQKVFGNEKKRVWICGDFNSPAQVRNEGYDYVRSCGWKDSYCLAQKKDIGNTVEEVIAGWEKRGVRDTGMRIDMIWTNRETEVNSSQVVFDGVNYPVVSDHYGVMITAGEQDE